MNVIGNVKTILSSVPVLKIDTRGKIMYTSSLFALRHNVNKRDMLHQEVFSLFSIPYSLFREVVSRINKSQHLSWNGTIETRSSLMGHIKTDLTILQRDHETKAKHYVVYVTNTIFLEDDLKKTPHTKSKQFLDNAIINNMFQLFFQPICCNISLKTIKYEALIRIVDGDNILSPDVFLPLSKKHDYYHMVSQIAIEKVLLKIIKHKIHITVNLSLSSFENRDIKETITSFMDTYSEYTIYLTIEILEDECELSPNIVYFLQRIRLAGISIALDDFGSNYGNVSKIYKIMPNVIKFDGDFVKDCKNSEYTRTLMKTIIDFCMTYKIETVAEYIEDESLFQLMKELGINYSQGYLFGKPMPIEHYIES